MQCRARACPILFEIHSALALTEYHLLPFNADFYLLWLTTLVKDLLASLGMVGSFSPISVQLLGQLKQIDSVQALPKPEILLVGT